MRGKSTTCRLRTLIFSSGLRPVTVKDRFELDGYLPASPRLAAHQSGRAIGCRVKYVIAVLTVSSYSQQTIERARGSYATIRTKTVETVPD